MINSKKYKKEIYKSNRFFFYKTSEEINNNKNTLPKRKFILFFICVTFIFLYTIYFETDIDRFSKMAFGQKAVFSPTNKNQNSSEQKVSMIPFKILSDKNYPYPVFQLANLIHGPAIVYNGIAISNNASSAKIEFSKWGHPSSLSYDIVKIPNKNISFLDIKGIIGDNAAGLMSPQIYYKGRYLSLNFGLANKIPESSQISIKLDVVGESNLYHIVFVNGRLQYESWVNNTLYKKISDNSNQLIDFVNLISSKGDKFLYLSNIQITIEKGTIINAFPFRIDFGKSTLNTPFTLNKDDSYYIAGYIFNDTVVKNDYKYILDDWKFLQVLNQEFELNPSNSYKIASNGWQIKNITEIKNENNPNKTSVLVESDNYIPMAKISIFDLILHIDLYNSILRFTSTKDILFIMLIISITLLFYPKKMRLNKKTNYRNA
jgi:hypothetical protein